MYRSIFNLFFRRLMFKKKKKIPLVILYYIDDYLKKKLSCVRLIYEYNSTFIVIFF